MLPPLWLKPREPNNKRTIVTQKLNTIDTRWNLNFSRNRDTCQARPLCGLGRRGTIFRGSLWCAELRGWKTSTGRDVCATWHASKLTYWWIELHSIFPTLINHIHIRNCCKKWYVSIFYDFVQYVLLIGDFFKINQERSWRCTSKFQTPSLSQTWVLIAVNSHVASAGTPFWKIHGFWF